MSLERRRYPRVAIAFPVRLEDRTGMTWQGESINLSPGGLKVKTDATLQPGRLVHVNFKLPDGGPGIATTSLVVRKDPDGLAFSFVDLERFAFERIRRVACSLKILLIEDDERVREVLAQMLAGLGHSVSQAAGGREGLARLDAGESVDLVLTDLVVPDMSGWDVVKAVKARRVHLPVGVITGTPEALLRQRGEPIDFVLFKPVTLEAVREAISRIGLSSLPRGEKGQPESGRP